MPPAHSCTPSEKIAERLPEARSPSRSGGQNSLCVNCHDPVDYNTPGSGWPNTDPTVSYDSRVEHAHFVYWGAYCLECHYEHGSNTPHMLKIGFTHTAGGGAVTGFGPCAITCHPSSYTSAYTGKY